MKKEYVIKVDGIGFQNARSLSELSEKQFIERMYNDSISDDEKWAKATHKKLIDEVARLDELERNPPKTVVEEAKKSFQRPANATASASATDAVTNMPGKVDVPPLTK